MNLDAHVALHRGAMRIDAAVDVEAGSTLAVLGPNGAGKTSLLHALAGLVPLDGGAVRLGSEVWDEPAARRFVPPERRRVAMVFQEHRLFPHLSVVDNVAFGPRARGVGRRESERRAMEHLEAVGLGSRSGARPSELSGGQAQRVALARALASEPEVLLLDEPLSALDVDTRPDVRRLLAHHLASFGGIAVVVTHDPVDAAALADSVVVLEDGAVTHRGAVGSLASRPTSAWAARWAGLNLFPGVVSDGGTVAVEGGGRLVVADGIAPGSRVWCTASPSAVALHRERPAGSARNVWPGTVDHVEPAGDRLRVEVSGVPPIIAEVTRAGAEALGLTAGSTVWVAVKATEIVTYPA